MKKIFLFAVVFTLLASSACFSQEEITLTTIMPVPQSNLGPPDFDTGWIDPPAQGGYTTISFSDDNACGAGNIDGGDPDRFLVVLQAKFPVGYEDAEGISNFGNGSLNCFAYGQLGQWYDQLGSNSIRISRGASTEYDVDKIRVCIWAW